jgi:hypothetical protein
MAIDALHVTVYRRDGGSKESTMHIAPSWELIEHELRTMDNYEKPILWLHQDRNIGDSDCLAVCGGSGLYHLQVADDVDWHEAFDPNGSDAEIEVWESDQGFSTARKFTWPVEHAIEIVRRYFERSEMHPDYRWTN